jgi:acetyl esterase/lipase
MGDSAGGNLVFSVSLKLKALRRKPSLYHIAISPWVNLEAIYPSYLANQKLDPVLTKDFAEYAASLYIGSHSVKDPFVSPVYGDFAGLTPSLIMYGSREILADDSVRLYEALQKAGVKSELFLSEGSLHVWPLVDIQSGSAQIALTRIRDFVDQNSTGKPSR